MKRTLLLLASIAVLFTAASCSKDNGSEKTDSTAPSITWASNPKFETKEISDTMSAKIGISAPGKIASFTITVTPPAADYISMINMIIGVEANKGSSTSSKDPVLDLINDPVVVTTFTTMGIPAGTSLKGTTTSTFDAGKFIPMLSAVVTPANNSTFKFTVNITDENNKSITKILTFHYTAGPTLTWSANPTFSSINLATATSLDAKMVINAPAKIDSCKITVVSSSTSLVGAVNYLVGKQYQGSKPVLDLIYDSTATGTVSAVGLPTGDKVKGQTSVSLDLTSLLTMLKGVISKDGNTTTTFVLNVSDQLGKKLSKNVVFSYSN